ncbi:MAG: TlpA disulfide reductase family protein [Rhizomicrobium sp.]|jgi:thiol-disulfide isomerase/thioredoxin
MPRLRPLQFAGLAVVAGAALVVLYVIFGRPVHAPGPPAALAKLEPVAPTTLPVVAFTDARGGRHTLAAFKGRYVLLNLWATWCAPCVRELPALAKLQSAMPPGGLAVVAVNVGRGNPADTLAFLKAHDASALTGYFDPDLGLMQVFGAFGLPLTVLFDPQGREIAHALGPADWDDPAAIAYFKSLEARAAS